MEARPARLWVIDSMQLELAGAGEDEATHPAVGIDDSLEVGKEFRSPLDLIEDGSIGCLTEKGAWVFGREGAGIGVFERKIGKLRGEQAGERGFSGLAGAGDRQDRESDQPLPSRIGSDAGNCRIGNR